MPTFVCSSFVTATLLMEVPLSEIALNVLPVGEGIIVLLLEGIIELYLPNPITLCLVVCVSHHQRALAQYESSDILKRSRIPLRVTVQHFHGNPEALGKRTRCHFSEREYKYFTAQAAREIFNISFFARAVYAEASFLLGK